MALICRIHREDTSIILFGVDEEGGVEEEEEEEEEKEKEEKKNPCPSTVRMVERFAFRFQSSVPLGWVLVPLFIGRLDLHMSLPRGTRCQACEYIRHSNEYILVCKKRTF